MSSFFSKIKDKIDQAKMHYGIGLNMAMDSFTNSLHGLFIDKEFFDDEFFEDLEEKLITLDVTPLLAMVLTDKIKEKIYKQRTSKDEFDNALFQAINEVANLDVNNDLTLNKNVLNVLLIVGINGVGKTTTISKITNLFMSEFSVELVAADTFRAGAINQLNEWAKRLNVPIIKTHQGHAPSAVIYEGIESAKNNSRNLLICDTAGRLHNQKNLMLELQKIHGVIDKNINSDAIVKTILVLDGTAGKNTIDQARAFNEITKLDGVIVTKLDSNAKVGMIINIGYELKVPIYYVTNGEQIEDIKKFDSNLYLSMLFSDK